VLGVNSERVGKAATGIFHQKLEELIVSISRAVYKTRKLSKMKIEVPERIRLQDQCRKISRPFRRQQVLNQFKELLSLKIDRIEVKEVC
jgi:hypothetical protein